MTRSVHTGQRPRVVDDWFQLPLPLPGATGQLVCFPHAGGDVSSFAALAAALAPDIEVWAVRLPGRGGRLAAALPSDFDTLVGLVVAALAPHLRPASGFYGQSFGAILAYDVARELPAGRRPGFAALASARSPITWPQNVPAGRVAAQGLLRDSGVPAEFWSDQSLLELVLGILEADLAVCRTYVHRPERVLDLPLHVLTGSGDPMVTGADLAGWSDRTVAAFGTSVVAGGHLLASTTSPGPVEIIEALWREHVYGRC